MRAIRYALISHSGRVDRIACKRRLAPRVRTAGGRSVRRNATERTVDGIPTLSERRWARLDSHEPNAIAIDGFQTDSAAFAKRPAWDFSALASVSNQSAISLKPSPRAVLAIPGYISVYS